MPGATLRRLAENPLANPENPLRRYLIEYGIFAPSQAPTLTRTDYVADSNSSLLAILGAPAPRA